MSKIYEALLRAELERTVTPHEQDDGAVLTLEDVLIPAEEKITPAYPVNISPAPEVLEQTASAPEPEISVQPETFDLSLVQARPWAPLLAALPALDERGTSVEQFRSLRSRLLELRDQRPLKSILVSSGLPGEGKSFVALNVAVALARRKGQRVLLVDGDMRRSSLHKALGATQFPGLSEYLAGKAALHEVMQHPEISGTAPLAAGLASLYFVSGGIEADKAGDLAANARFGEALQQLGAVFDWIIIDSSPVNLVSDAVSLSSACDGVLLVAREGVTKYKTAQQAQVQFKNANLLGFVLNALHKLPTKSDYYGTYEGYKAEA